MKLCSIASGSGGNCIYVGSANTHVLIDAGISKKKIEAGLLDIGVPVSEISGIFITHEHSDHIAGLGVMSRGYSIPIYASSGTIRGIKQSKAVGEIQEALLNPIDVNHPVTHGELIIEAFHISHDSIEPTGYKITHEEKSLAVVTDLGCYDEYTINKLCKLDAVFLEANHDVHMLEVGKYPYSLKKRVLGNKGHLSNELSGRLLCDILHKKLKYVMLGHISKDNNYDELAYETVKLEVNLSEVPFSCKDFKLMVAKKDGLSEMIVLNG